jgi:hypothetical protein
MGLSVSLRSHIARSASTTLPSPASQRISLTQARFIGSGNVVGRRPLAASFSWQIFEDILRHPWRKKHILRMGFYERLHSD